MSILASNFTSNSLSGTVQVVNQFANVLLQTTPYAFEGDKQFVVKLRRSGTEGLVLLTTPSIVIKDIAEAVSITSNVNVIPEGGSVKFTFVTANAASNSTLYYSTVPLFGTVNAADFFVSNTGSFVLNNNQAEIVLTAVEDLSAVEEQGERFALQIRIGSATGNVVYTGGNILIMDTSNVPGVTSLVLASENIYESEAAILTINAYNAYGNAGTIFYYTLTGNTDIFSANSGSIVINENIANLEIITESSIPEGESRQLGIQIRKDSITGDIISVSNTVVVNSYITGNITPRISRVSNVVSNVSTSLANDAIQFNINTAAATNGETLYYTTLGNVDTFIGNSFGSTTVTGNTAIVTIIPSYLLHVGNVRLQARRNSITGPILGISNMVNVEPNFEVFESLTNYTGNLIYESEASIFRINTFYGTPGESTFYYRVVGNANIFSSVTGTANSASNIIIIAESNVPNNQVRTLQLVLFADVLDGTEIARSSNINVNNLLPNVIANSRISLVNNTTSNVSTSIAYDNIRFNANTRAAANGETLYYVVTGNAAPYVTGNTGSFSINGNIGTITVRPVYDDITIRDLGLEIRRGSISGIVLSNSNTVEILPNAEIFVNTTAPVSIIESEGAQIKINTQYRQGIRNFYYEVFGNADIIGATTGTTLSTSNIIVTAESSVPTGQTRSFYLNIKENNSSGNIIYTTPNITVTPYTSGVVNSRVSIVTGVTPNTSSVGKLQSVTFTINTVNSPNGNVLYFATRGTALSSDFSTANTGSITINGNTASLTLTVASGADVSTGRSFVLDIKRGSATTGVTLGTSSTVTFLNNEYIQATGGSISTSGGFRRHTFTGSDTFSVNSLSYTSPRNIIDYLVVAGGGGGGGTDGNGAGGGGAGGMLNGSNTLTVARAFEVQVGGGGAGAPGGNGGASSGTPSYLRDGPQAFNIVSIGGGHGGSRYFQAGAPGGSGGGGSSYQTTAGTGTPGQGNSGGGGSPAPPSGAGGGGKGGVGAQMGGGAGGLWPINSTTYAGGGGGSREPNIGGAGGSGGGGAGGGTGGAGPNTNATAGGTNTGGGGGGAIAIAQQRAGAAGGSGIVIVRYPYV